MIWISFILIKVPSVLSGGSDQPNVFPFIKDVTSQLYVALSNDTKVYKLANVADMMNDTRRNVVFNLGLIFSRSEMWKRSRLCYMTSLTYRTAVWDLYRYFDVRDLYVHDLEFEIGYLTQEVIYHYEVILEIYQMVDKRYIQYKERNFAPVNYVFFLYGHILEKSKIIIHLCNMMHELENKYIKTKSKGVFAEEHIDKPKTADEDSKTAPKVKTNSVDLLRIEHMRQEAAKAKANRILQKQRNAYNKQMQKFGLTTRKKKRLKKKGSWPLDYGWSIEDW